MPDCGQHQTFLHQCKRDLERQSLSGCPGCSDGRFFISGGGGELPTQDHGTIADLTGAAILAVVGASSDLAGAGTGASLASAGIGAGLDGAGEGAGFAGAGIGADSAGAGTGAVSEQAEAKSGRTLGPTERVEGLNTHAEAGVCMSGPGED